MNDSRHNLITEYLKKETEIINALDVSEIETMIDILENARTNRKRIFTCGNGGSAATAAHMVCDLENACSKGKDIKYDAECLSDNTPLMMALSNDLSYEEALAEIFKNKGHEGDVLICISGSGNSENIVRAAQTAKDLKMTTIGLVAYDGGRLKGMVDHCVHVNIDNMQIAEDVHMILDHVITWALCESNDTK